MSDLATTFAVLGAMVALFVVSRVPAAPVALAAVLVLYFAGVLDAAEALAGFGDSAVVFIASLFVVSAALQASGVTAWVGKRLIAQAGESRNRLLAFTMLLAAGMTALVGTSAAVAALLPVVVLAALRLGRRPSKLMMPLAFAAHAGSMLLLTGSLANVLVSDAAQELGLQPLGFFGPTALGLPILAGSIAIVLLFGERLLPERAGRGLPPDLSRHHRTLTAQYELVRQIHQLEIGPGSAYAGMAKAALTRMMESSNRPDFALIAIRPRDPAAPLLRAGDTVLVRGTEEAVADFAAKAGLQPSAEPPDPAGIQQALFNAREGFAEVVLPPRSGLIGQRVYPGMLSDTGELMILGIQRQGESLGPGEVSLAAGDTLLLQGEWENLDRRIREPDVLVVASPEAIRSQAGTPRRCTDGRPGRSAARPRSTRGPRWAAAPGGHRPAPARSCWRRRSGARRCRSSGRPPAPRRARAAWPGCSAAPRRTPPRSRPPGRRPGPPRRRGDPPGRRGRDRSTASPGRA